jgi:extracellular factor (EF) 3-hydroxypalmitic acid methyl ester biosynthesis protein
MPKNINQMREQNSTANHEIKDAVVEGRTSDGIEIQAKLLRLTRYMAVVEICNPGVVLRISEVINDFKIGFHERNAYSGRAVVHDLVNAGLEMSCEVTLDENSWHDEALVAGLINKDKLRDEFKEFVNEWQKFYLVSAEYKVVIADLQTFLTDLRSWLEKVELKIQSAPAVDRVQLEQEVAHCLRDSAVPAINNLFERFEIMAENIEEDLQPAHRAFGKRQLHPLLLCAPFIHRTYTKPLGYAGDYEMMNMIIRNGYEGTSLFAKLVNAHILDQAPARAVRNRVAYLAGKIFEEASRVSRLGKVANIYSVACGPAREVEDFLSAHPLSEQTKFRLLDFNEETLRYTNNRLEQVKRKHHRKTPIKLIKNSVQNLLKGPGKRSPEDPGKDLIYCSGLYDYLSDRIIKMLNTYLYDQLLPGGILIVGNFATCNPIRNLMEHFLEWSLIYRDGKQLAALAPERAPTENCKIIAEATGTNIFLEVRKPL